MMTVGARSEAIDYSYLPGFHVLKEIRKDTLCLASTETIRIIREKGRGMEVGEEGTLNDTYTHIHYVHIITIYIRGFLLFLQM